MQDSDLCCIYQLVLSLFSMKLSNFLNLETIIIIASISPICQNFICNSNDKNNLLSKKVLSKATQYFEENSPFSQSPLRFFSLITLKLINDSFFSFFSFGYFCCLEYHNHDFNPHWGLLFLPRKTNIVIVLPQIMCLG